MSGSHSPQKSQWLFFFVSQLNARLYFLSIIACSSLLRSIVSHHESNYWFFSKSNFVLQRFRFVQLLTPLLSRRCVFCWLTIIRAILIVILKPQCLAEGHRKTFDGRDVRSNHSRRIATRHAVARSLIQAVTAAAILPIDNSLRCFATRLPSDADSPIKGTSALNSAAKKIRNYRGSFVVRLAHTHATRENNGQIAGLDAGALLPAGCMLSVRQLTAQVDANLHGPDWIGGRNYIKNIYWPVKQHTSYNTRHIYNLFDALTHALWR